MMLVAQLALYTLYTGGHISICAWVCHVTDFLKLNMYVVTMYVHTYSTPTCKKAAEIIQMIFIIVKMY